MVHAALAEFKPTLRAVKCTAPPSIAGFALRCSAHLRISRKACIGWQTFGTRIYQLWISFSFSDAQTPTRILKVAVLGRLRAIYTLPNNYGIPAGTPATNRHLLRAKITL
jgi:hypothetical protein